MTRRSIRGGAVATAAVLGLVLVLALGLAACGTETGDGGSSSPSSSSDQPKQGGTLTLSYLTEPSSLDPAVAWNVIDWQIEHDIYQGFLQYAHESGQAGTELIPCLATEVPSTDNGGISADGKTYTFHLRKGVMFQPPVSREVTAADFKYSFERMMTEPRAPATSFYMGVVGADEYMKGKADEITGFKAVDDYHRRDHAEEPGPLVPQRRHHGLLRRRVQGVGREVGQAVQPASARHRPVRLPEVDARP